MYHIATQFDVPANRKGDFVAAALEYCRDSRVSEPRPYREELVLDKENPGRFYLYEVYKSSDSFEAHLESPRRRRFLEIISDYGAGHVPLIEGNLIENTFSHMPKNAPDLFMMRYLAWPDVGPHA